MGAATPPWRRRGIPAQSVFLVCCKLSGEIRISKVGADGVVSPRNVFGMRFEISHLKWPPRLRLKGGFAASPEFVEQAQLPQQGNAFPHLSLLEQFHNRLSHVGRVRRY